MDGGDQLLSAEHESGTAVVVQDEWMLRLHAREDDRRASVLIANYTPAQIGVSRRQMAVAGRLPEGATGAEVVRSDGSRFAADCAGGAWLLILDRADGEHVAAVRCHDAEGRTVPAPLPKAGEVVPVDDATELCPACGEVSWAEIGSREVQRRAPIEDIDSAASIRRIVCTACGHQETPGMLVGLPPQSDAGGVSDAELPARVKLRPAELDQRERRALANLDFPVCASAEVPHQVDCAVLEGRVTLVTVLHVIDSEREAVMLVESARGDLVSSDPEAAVREALRRVGDNAPPPRRSEAGLRLWLRYGRSDREPASPCRHGGRARRRGGAAFPVGAVGAMVVGGQLASWYQDHDHRVRHRPDNVELNLLPNPAEAQRPWLPD